MKRTTASLRVLLAAASLLVMAWGALPAQAAGGSVNLDQWASLDNAWQNGNLNGNNARYPEGGIVPFRLAVEGLSAGQHSIHINYDFTAGGHKAYDFLATWDVTNAKGKICGGAGGGISSMCKKMPGASSAAFPNDGYRVDGLTVHGAEIYSAAPRRLTIWGGTITSITGPTHSGSPNGNSSADFLVRFRSTGSAVLLAWGGHLAQSAYWNRSAGGPSDGAGQVSGAPWHMRTLQLDASGNKNQDRSIQPSAIVGELPPFALAPPTPKPTPRPTAPPAAPVPTPRPPGGGPAPGPGGPGPGPGNPNIPYDPADPVGPVVTVPPTSTVDPSPGRSNPFSAALVIALVIGAAAGIALAATGNRRVKRLRRRT
jgi:hypothetical protein